MVCPPVVMSTKCGFSRWGLGSEGRPDHTLVRCHRGSGRHARAVRDPRIGRHWDRAARAQDHCRRPSGAPRNRRSSAPGRGDRGHSRGPRHCPRGKSARDDHARASGRAASSPARNRECRTRMGSTRPHKAEPCSQRRRPARGLTEKSSMPGSHRRCLRSHIDAAERPETCGDSTCPKKEHLLR